MAGVEEEKPLRIIVAAFEQLADVASRGADMEVGLFCHACDSLSVLFGCLGTACRFGGRDFESKVHDLKEASQSISTLKNMIELDIEQNCVRQDGSHTRNLLRIKRGIDFIRVICEEIIKSDGESMRDAVSVAYDKVFAPYHSLAIRNAVANTLFALPSKSQLFTKLKEDEGSAKLEMQNFIITSGHVIQYVEGLFNFRRLGIDW